MVVAVIESVEEAGSAFERFDRKWVPTLEFSLERALWSSAVLLFVVGDLLTTGLGFAAGAIEANPLPRMVLTQFDSVSMVGAFMVLWKGSVVAFFGYLYVVTPRPHRLGIPIGLTVLGLAVVVWNLGVSVLLLT